MTTLYEYAIDHPESVAGSWLRSSTGQYEAQKFLDLAGIGPDDPEAASVIDAMLEKFASFDSRGRDHWLSREPLIDYVKSHTAGIGVTNAPSRLPHMQQESMLANALPYVRIYGMPAENEVPPGMANPLTPEERAYVQEKLDREQAS